jgi:hypothetical protein
MAGPGQTQKGGIVMVEAVHIEYLSGGNSKTQDYFMEMAGAAMGLYCINI